jgi:hypothetical protein
MDANLCVKANPQKRIIGRRLEVDPVDVTCLRSRRRFSEGFSADLAFREPPKKRVVCTMEMAAKQRHSVFTIRPRLCALSDRTLTTLCLCDLRLM